MKPAAAPSRESIARAGGHSRGRIAAPLVCLSFAIGVLVVSTRGANEVSANSRSLLGPDYDSDGLADLMEHVLGTSEDNPDTDLDGYYDLEEVARGSDPLDQDSRPSAGALDLGMYTYTENGHLNLHMAIFVKDSTAMEDLDFEFGIVIRNQRFVVGPNLYWQATRSFYSPLVSNSNDSLLVLEMPIPVSFVQKLGQVSVYGITRDHGPNGRAPVIDLVNVVDFDGDLMEIIPAPMAVQQGNGIVYRPLSGDAPSTASPGQICWQDVSAVGTNGASILFEVEDASCEDFDGFCNSGECGANVGKVLALPDMGTLLGG